MNKSANIPATKAQDYNVMTSIYSFGFENVVLNQELGRTWEPVKNTELQALPKPTGIGISTLVALSTLGVREIKPFTSSLLGSWINY